MLTTLNSNPEMMGLSQIPINAHILCFLWQGEGKEALAKTNFTMSHLYNELLKRLTLIYAHNYKSAATENLDNIFSICEQEISALASLAYHSFKGGDIQFIAGSIVKEYIPPTLLGKIIKQFGVLRAFNKNDFGYAGQYYFIHQTYQEFFAALYIVRTLSITHADRDDELQRRKKAQELFVLIKENKDETRYQVIWTFVAGLLATPEYIKGADYFWDAIVDFPETQLEALTFHPHINQLQKKHRIFREAFLTHAYNQSQNLPIRLSSLKDHFQALYSWQAVQQTEDFVRSWSGYNSESVRVKKYHRYRRQFILDSSTLSITNMSFSVIDFLSRFQPLKACIEMEIMMKINAIKQNFSMAFHFDVSAEELSPNLKIRNYGMIEVLVKDLKNSYRYRDLHILKGTKTIVDLETENNRIIEQLRILLKADHYRAQHCAATSLLCLGVKDDEAIQSLLDVLINADCPDTITRTIRALVFFEVRNNQVIKALDSLIRKKSNVFSLFIENPASLLFRENFFGVAGKGRILYEAAKALFRFGIRNEFMVLSLRVALRDVDSNTRFGAAKILLDLGIKDELVVQVLRNSLYATRP